MTLNPPDDENCGKCKYCISKIPNSTGIKGYDGIEIFSCHRDPHWHEVKITDWCGEWRIRL